MGGGITVTKENFEAEVLRSAIPVLVDFWAEWCRPCKAVSPLLDELGQEYEGRLKIGKVNVDEESELAGQHNIVSIPTMVIYKDGVIVRQQAGALPKEHIKNLFQDLVS
jgi:thioredoxin 1